MQSFPPLYNSFLGEQPLVYVAEQQRKKKKKQHKNKGHVKNVTESIFLFLTALYTSVHFYFKT